MRHNQEAINLLKEEIQQLRRRIETGNDSLPLELGIPKVLMEAEESLSLGQVDPNKLEKAAYGIFRLVTESYSFEQSPLGKELLEIRTKIRNFARN